VVCYCFSHIRSNTKSWFPKGLQDSREGIAICSPPQKRWAANPIYNHVKPFRTINIAGISGFYFLLLSISLSHPNSSLVGGWPTPLKNMSSSVGMMTFPTEWKVIKFHGSKPPTRYYSGFTHEKMWFSLIFYIPPTNQTDPCFTGLARQVVLRVLKLPARWFGRITMLETRPSFVVCRWPKSCWSAVPNMVNQCFFNMQKNMVNQCFLIC